MGFVEKEQLTKAIDIRRYQAKHQEQVWNLHNAALHDVGAHLGNGPWDEDLKNIETQYLKNNGDFLVGLIDDNVIAMGALRRVDEDVAEIKRMRVHPEYQRRGYGQLMLLQLESRAMQLGYKKLVLDTTTKQVGAQRLYEKNGFTEYGMTKVGPFDVILYRKEL
jgi:ribosomal protein S18 acetylase RimI-like enzyme